MQRYFFSLLLTFFTLVCLAQPKVVAHRGYWKTEGSAQNSIASFQKAAQIGCWGSEFDVWLTADGVPVVFHDATVEGIRIEDTTYATLMNIRLKNGEFIPTLQQYLTEAQRYPDCRLIFEVKPHRSEKRDYRISEMSVELINMLGLADRTDYISFSKNVCKRIHELAPNAKIAYLNGELSPTEIKDLGWTGIDYNSKVFDNHPDWALEAKKLGLEVNVWTVDGEEALKRFAKMPGIDIITTNDPETLIEINKH
ncbi:MAG: glycerophosphodiester phosphodiesterase [Bacteroidaceae bacterium]|nr:glycerophosphodiester phosphodiesterase [Bacteroidaceae bacterium]